MSKKPKRVGERKKFEFLPLTLCIETLGGIATPLVLRGTPLPAVRQQVFSTAADDQEAVEIRVLAGESPLAKRNLGVQTFTLTDIPKAPRGEPQLAVTFKVDRACRIKASAVEKKSNRRVAVEFDDAQPHLTDDKIKALVQQALDSRAEDEVIVQLAEARNRANSLTHRAESRLKANQESRLFPSQDKQIERVVAALGIALQEDHLQDIRERSDELEKLIHPPFSGDFFGGFPDVDVFSQLFGGPKGGKRASTRASPQAAAKPGDPPRKTSTTRRENLRKVSTSSKRLSEIGKIFGPGEFTLDPKLAFVLMPFAEGMKPIYDDHIRPVVESEGLSCLRADEIAGTGLITSDVWEKVNRARFLIADLTGKNPNVFYEVGIAHALGKDVILLTQDMDDVPFDLKLVRCITYSYTPRGTKDMESKLRATIKKLMQSA